MHPRNVGEIPDASGVGTVGNPVCVVPGTLIHANSQILQVKDIHKGINVLGHDGRYHKVSRVYKRLFKGDIYSVTVTNLGQTTVTGDHHVLALRMHNELYKMRSQSKYIPDWCLIKELEKGDVILYPLLEETCDIEAVKFDVEKSRFDFKSKALPESIKVNNDFLLLVGYYLSEGYVRTDKCKGTLGFVFGAKEKEYVNETACLMKKIFGLTPARLVRNKNKTAVDIPFYSAPLARFFAAHFGKGASNKRLPHWMMLLPPEKQKIILCSLFRGDGYVDEKRQRAKYVTISQQLAYQLKLLLLRQKIIASFSVGKAYGMHKKSYLFYIQDDESLRKISDITKIKMRIKAREKNIHKSWLDNNYYYATIREIKSNKYRGLVYNLEVDDVHSYVSDSLSLHNCGDIMKMFIKIENDIIVDAKFKTFGCGAAISTSSMVTEMVKGKSIDEALKISNKAVAEALGGLPPIKMHCSVLAEEALKSALADYYRKIGKDPSAFEPKKDSHEHHEH
ncbi:MAG: iron-sulfur cluster assembly scaffold protein [Candidatus Omnitrophica bacterium]|nr:iron-sulfur cluster assembly scaffold protein [Candidatus Omnitrophota bacterium]